MFYERVQGVGKILNKTFILYRQVYFCTNNSIKAGNDIIDDLTSEDMENMPLEFRM